jgi:hypothetical protein
MVKRYARYLEERKWFNMHVMAARKLTPKQAAKKAAHFLFEYMKTLNPSAASAMKTDLRRMASKRPSPTAH